MRNASVWRATVRVGWVIVAACMGPAWAGGQDTTAAKPAQPLTLACPVQVKPAYPATGAPVGGTVRAKATVRKGRVVAVEILTPRSPFDAGVTAALMAYECIDTSTDFQAVQDFNFEPPKPAPAITAVAAPVIAPPPPPVPAPLPEVATKPDAAALANLMVNDSWNEIQGMLGVMFKGLDAQFRSQGEMTRSKTIMLEELRNALSRDLMVRVFTNGLSEQLTDPELAEALAYQRSPAGRKMATFARSMGRDPRFVAALLNEVCVKTLARLDALGESDPGLAMMCRRK